MFLWQKRDIPFIFFIVLLSFFQFLLCALLDYLLCSALFLSKYTHLLLQSFLLLPLLRFSLPVIIVMYFVFFSPYCIFPLFPFFYHFLFLFLLCLHSYCCSVIHKYGHTYFYTAIFTYYFSSNFIYFCCWCTTHNGSICCSLFYHFLFFISCIYFDLRCFIQLIYISKSFLLCPNFASFIMQSCNHSLSKHFTASAKNIYVFLFSILLCSMITLTISMLNNVNLCFFYLLFVFLTFSCV